MPFNQVLNISQDKTSALSPPHYLSVSITSPSSIFWDWHLLRVAKANQQTQGDHLWGDGASGKFSSMEIFPLSPFLFLAEETSSLFQPFSSFFSHFQMVKIECRSQLRLTTCTEQVGQTDADLQILPRK